MQEAFATAVERWPRDGVPANPGGWIVRTARNSAIDRLRRERRYAEKLRELEALGGGEESDEAMELDPRRPAAAVLHLLPPRARAARRAWR